jgi:hypothetical protein
MRKSSLYGSTSELHAIYAPCRCLVAVEASKDESQFLAGTCSLKEPNTVRLLVFDEQVNELSCRASYAHPSEAWALAASPTDRQMLLSCHSSGTATGEDRSHGYAVTLWSMPPPSDAPTGTVEREGLAEMETLPLASLASLGSCSRPACAVLWGPHQVAASNMAAILAGNDLSLWDVGGGGGQEQARVPLCQDLGTTAASWDPHCPTSLAVAVGGNLKLVDTREKTVGSAFGRHNFAALSLQHNPNKVACVVSCGEDRIMKFWDVRVADPTRPVKAIQTNMNHWCTAVRYNPFHDQLLATGGSDGSVKLWRVSSISSSPAVLDEDMSDASRIGGGGHPDILVRDFEGHEESVYSVAWSAADAWIMAALSYDGRVMLHHVPSSEKYRLLL